MKQQFLRFERWATSASMAGACLMMALASCLAIHQIVTRFILESPAKWTEVLIRFSLIWMVFLGIPTAFRQGAMVSVDLLYRMSGGRMRRVLDIVVAVAALVLCSVMLWWGVNVALFIIGMFIETGAAIIVLAPILVPVAVHFGIDPVHFGMVVVVNLALGMVTPPFWRELVCRLHRGQDLARPHRQGPHPVHLGGADLPDGHQLRAAALARPARSGLRPVGCTHGPLEQGWKGSAPDLRMVWTGPGY